MSTDVYRVPVPLVEPGTAFRTARWLTIGILFFFALLAAAHVGGLVAYDVCTSYFSSSTCARMDIGPTLTDLGVSIELQRSFVEIPASVPLTLLVIDAVLAFFLVRPRSATLDEASRSLVLRTFRLFGRSRVTRIRYDDVEDAQIRTVAGFWHSVRVVDRRGAVHEVTGLRFGESRAREVLLAIEDAAELPPVEAAGATVR